MPLVIARALDRHFVELITELRQLPPFDQLTLAPWACLVNLALGWSRGDDAPSQQELGALVGCSERSLRRSLDDLKGVGALRVLRGGGGCVYGIGRQLAMALLDLARGRDVEIWVRRRVLFTPRQPASVARRDLRSDEQPASVAGRDLRSDEQPARVAGRDLRSDEQPARVAGRDLRYDEQPARAAGRDLRSDEQPARVAGWSPARPASVAGRGSPGASVPVPFANAIPNNLQHIRVTAPVPPDATGQAGRSSARASSLIEERELRSSSLPERGTPSEPTATPSAGTTPYGRGPLPLDVVRAAAHRALAARYAHAFPGQPVPTTFSAVDVEIIVATTAQGTWTEAELEQAHLDALAGAGPRSKQTPPSVRYVWGKVEHFLQNAREGRAKRLAAQPVVRPPRAPKPPPEPVATFDQIIAATCDVIGSLDAIPERTRPSRTRFLPDPGT